MKTTCLYLLFLFLVLSCRKADTDLLDNRYGKTVDVEKTGLIIPLHDRELTSYQISCFYKDIDENEQMYAYNSYLHALDVFDLTGKTIVASIQLEQEGENGVMKPVSGLSVQDRDNIWLYSQGSAYLCNHLGKVKNAIKLPVPDDGFAFVDVNFSIATSKLHYNRLRNSIFYLTVSKANDTTSYSVYEYYPDTNEKKMYPVTGIGMEKKISSGYGWMQMPNVTYTDQSILYNFPVTSNLYRIDIGSGKVDAFGGQSQFTANRVAEFTLPFDFPNGNRHILENVHFFEIQYSPEENVYYRLHLDKTEAGNDDKFRENYNKKDLYLTVFDAGFTIIHESKLASGTYNYYNCWGTMSEGFLIANDNELNAHKNPEKLELDLFRIK